MVHNGSWQHNSTWKGKVAASFSGSLGRALPPDLYLPPVFLLPLNCCYLCLPTTRTKHSLTAQRTEIKAPAKRPGFKLPPHDAQTEASTRGPFIQVTGSWASLAKKWQFRSLLLRQLENFFSEHHGTCRAKLNGRKR